MMLLRIVNRKYMDIMQTLYTFLVRKTYFIKGKFK